MFWRKKLCFYLNTLRLVFIFLVSVTVYTMFFYNANTSSSKSFYAFNHRFKEIYNYFRSVEINSFSLAYFSTDDQFFLNSNATLNDEETAVEYFYNFNASMPLTDCPLIPPRIGKRLKLNLQNRSLNDLRRVLKVKQRHLNLGGRWKPPYCISRHRVAIVVPYRDRQNNLELFLQHMHPFLAKQQ